MSELTDYFAVGAAIQTRLRDASQALGLLAVDDLAPLADAISGAQDGDIIKRILPLVPRSPAAFVGYDTEVMAQEFEGGGHMPMQRWLVVLAVKNAADTAKGSGVLLEAGPLILNVIQSLTGWRPALQGVGELRRVAAPRPVYGPGVGLFPTAFLAPLYLAGVNS